jgi:hypothetical protein
MEDVTDPPSSTPGGRTGSAPVRVLLVDDEPLIRAGLRLILEARPASRSWARPTTVSLLFGSWRTWHRPWS